MGATDMSQTTFGPRKVRDRNERHVLEALLESTSITQTEIAERAGLSRATVSDIVKVLDASGLISRGRVAPGAAPASSGRPPQAISLDPDAGVVVGVDIGHDHIRLVRARLADDPSETEELLALEQPDFAVCDEPERALALVTTQIREMMDGRWDQLVGVGVGIAGPVDHERVDLATPSVMRGWRGISIDDELRNRLGVADLPVRIENDASLGALAELRWGAARDYEHVVYVQCSRGIGAGLILDGQLFHGARGFAGEIGHTRIPGRAVDDGPPCQVCGNPCLEQQASPRAIVELLGETYSAETFARLAKQAREHPDGRHRRVFATAARDLGRALANVVGLLNPELILIGGRYGEHAFDVGYDDLMSGLRRSAYAPPLDGVTVRRAARGRRGPAEGAVLLVLQQELASFLRRRLDARGSRLGAGHRPRVNARARVRAGRGKRSPSARAPKTAGAVA